jgi:hypothetical protein
MLKKRSFLIIMVLAVMLTACNKSKDETSDPFSAPYNGASVEQNKSTLENNGVQFVDQIDQMQKVQAIPVIVHFADISSGDAFSKNAVTREALKPIRGFTSIKEYNGLKKLLKSTQSSGPENLAAAWDSVVGRYTYDTISQIFVKSELSDEVVIEFPGLETDKTNTASITINNFTYISLVDPVINIDDGSPTQLPTALHVELSYTGNVISTWDYSASFQTDGMPLAFNSTLIVDDFSFSASLSHDPYSNASITYSFKHADQLLFETHAQAMGDWSTSNIDSNTVNHIDSSYVWQYNPITLQYEQVLYTDEYSTLYFENVVKNANAYIQIMNIKVAGQIDFNQLVPLIRTIEDDTSLSDHQYVVKIADDLNLYSKLVVVTTDNNEKIATAEAYTYLDDYDDWNIGMRFVFADGSKIDAKTYFNEGFDGLITAINNLIADINDEHNLNISPINK